MPNLAPLPQAVYPLTLFDDQYAGTSFVTGWLVEGIVDDAALRSALDRLVNKWRTLAGRLEHVPGDEKIKWQLRIPLGPLPTTYPTYALTTTTSDVPLSKYISLPLPAVSASLPHSLFFHSIPRTNTAWASTNHPLTCWHITHFPSNMGQQYSCIGFAWAHGIFDGMGASFIVRALEAEIHGREWDVPALPREGLNTNALHAALDNSKDLEKLDHYRGFSVLGPWWGIKFVAWNLWQTWWHGAQSGIVILPKEAYSSLVGRVRADLASEGKDNIRVSTGDVLTAWMFKTIYSDGTSPHKIVHCANVVSFRHLFSTPSDSLDNYPYNCFIPLPYPLMSVSDLTATPLHTLTRTFANSRLSFSLEQPIAIYKTLQTASRAKGIFATLPIRSEAHESLIMTNVSPSRILEADWSAIGGERIVCGYRGPVSDNSFPFTNMLCIAGRLADGSTVLDIVLNKRRWERVKAEVEELMASSKF